MPVLIQTEPSAALQQDIKVFLGPVEAGLARDSLGESTVIILGRPRGYWLYNTHTGKWLMNDGTWRQ